jgi:uncharacterized phage protein (TIGR02220 family)
MGEVLKLQQDECPELHVKPTQIDQAKEVLEFLNKKTGKCFRACNPRGDRTANAEAIITRLNEGYTVQDMKSVIAMKCREWLYDENMVMNLNPLTLFKRQKFESYIGQIGPEDDA